jgi:hypothetical protein
MATDTCRPSSFEWIKRSVDYQQCAVGPAAVPTRRTR